MKKYQLWWRRGRRGQWIILGDPKPGKIERFKNKKAARAAALRLVTINPYITVALVETRGKRMLETRGGR